MVKVNVGRVDVVKRVSRAPFALAILGCASVNSFHAFSRKQHVRMDLEMAPGFGMAIPNSAGDASHSSRITSPPAFEDAERANGMPWTTSIGEGLSSPPLTYMPFWEWQMSFVKEHLSNLEVLPCTAEDSVLHHASTTDFGFNENAKKGARIVNVCFKSDEYRKVRMTYYDAGEKCQVFNSVFYPHESSNLPVLGIDLLSFNGKRYLGIVDFQPIHDDEEKHSTTFEQSILKPIRDKYPPLHGEMSAKFYDETQFFSKQMLFARFEDGSIVQDDLFPAFQEYVTAHVDLVKNTESEISFDTMSMVEGRQAAYDTYSAARDPATGLFASMFGKQWADEFVHGFLFSHSEGAESPEPPKSSPPQPQEANSKEAVKSNACQGVPVVR